MAFQGFLKQSTAVDVLVGPFLDESDGKTAETGLTISQADVRLSKNGQNMAQKNDSTSCAHDELGMYNCELDATDTNTVGQLTISIHESGALPVRLDYHIVEEAVYDAMYGASAAGPLQSTTAGRTLDVTANGEAGLDFGNTTGTIDAAQLGADCITAAKIADDAIAAEHIASGAIVAATFASGAINAAAIATDAITSNELADGAITAAKLGGDCITAAKIADDAIAAEHIASNAFVAATFAASSLDGKGDWNTTTPPTAAAIVNEWESQSQADPTGFHVNVKEVNGTAQTANDNGADINDILVDTAVIGSNGAGLSAIPWNSAWDAEVQSEVDDALVAKGLDHLLAASVAGSDIADDSIIAKLVSKESTADWDDFANTTDSLQAIRDRGDAAWITATGFNTTTPPTAAAIVNEWESQSQADPTGFHVNVKEVNGTAQTANDNGADINDILADTNELQGDLANGGRLDLLIDSIISKVDVIDGIADDILVDTAVIGAAGAGLTDLGGMSSTMKAQINTEVDTAFTTQMADSVPSDGTIATREQAIYMIVQMLSEMSVSGTTMTVKKVDGSTSLMTFTLSDATNPTSITRAS